MSDEGWLVRRPVRRGAAAGVGRFSGLGVY